MRVRLQRASTLIALVLLVSGCGNGADHPTDLAVGDSVPLETVDLPAPRINGGMVLEEAIAARRSHREFTEDALSLQELSQLLWAAQGVTEEEGAGRAAPSAGGTYPLELYVASGDGISHYVPAGHRLQMLQVGDARRLLADAAVGQQHVADAAVVIVVAAVFARTEARYGDRAERYVHLEAGHSAQNILLQAVSLGLAAVPVGAFDDGRVRAVLGLPTDHLPLYLIPVGRPAGG
jgi:SagB-type dehydrogenase family enzyme